MIELVGSRRENSKTFKLDNGKRQLIISTAAIHYKDNYTDESELWKDINLTFADGKITKAPYILEVSGLGITLTSKKTGTMKSLALERIGSKETKTPVPWKFVKNQAIWKNATLDTDIVIEAGANLIRFKRVLHSIDAPLEAEFSHREFVGEAADISLHTSARDADGEALEVVKTDVDGKITETLNSKVDLSRVKFPIVIDPTLTIQPSAKDTYLAEPSPTSNYGADEYLYLADSIGYTRRPILEFDISELPVGATLTSAVLQLYYYTYSGDNPTGKTVWAYKLTRTDWVELEATWNIYKTGSNWTTSGGDYVTSGPSGGSTTFPAGYDWLAWSVLDIVQDAYDGSVAAEFLVKFETEQLASGWSGLSFRSTDYTTDPTKQPKLVIDYAVAPTSVTDGDLIGIGIIRKS